MPLSALGGLLLALAGSACGAPLRATQAEAGASPRWYALDQPPLVAGIRLGDSLAHVRSVLGSPTEYRRLVGGAHELVYWPPGLAVITTDAQGVALIGLLSPEAPEVAGVRVGDPVPHLVQTVGATTPAKQPTHCLSGRGVGHSRDRGHHGVAGADQQYHLRMVQQSDAVVHHAPVARISLGGSERLPGNVTCTCDHLKFAHT